MSNIVDLTSKRKEKILMDINNAILNMELPNVAYDKIVRDLDELITIVDQAYRLLLGLCSPNDCQSLTDCSRYYDSVLYRAFIYINSNMDKSAILIADRLLNILAINKGRLYVIITQNIEYPKQNNIFCEVQNTNTIESLARIITYIRISEDVTKGIYQIGKMLDLLDSTEV